MTEDETVQVRTIIEKLSAYRVVLDEIIRNDLPRAEMDYLNGMIDTLHWLLDEPYGGYLRSITRKAGI